ncbi:MAG: hypothetical protein ACP5VN_05130 [Acidobacteriota bacterium]
MHPEPVRQGLMLAVMIAATEALFEEIRAHLHEGWAITHATLEPEVAGCGETDVLGHWEEHG